MLEELVDERSRKSAADALPLEIRLHVESKQFCVEWELLLSSWTSGDKTHNVLLLTGYEYQWALVRFGCDPVLPPCSSLLFIHRGKMPVVNNAPVSVSPRFNLNSRYSGRISSLCSANRKSHWYASASLVGITECG